MFDSLTHQVIGESPSVQCHMCSVVSAPEVDASFLSQLQAAGLFFKVIFPIQDNGNQRGYVVWANQNFADHSFLNYSTEAGYARITGVTWQNQFQSLSWTTPDIPDVSLPKAVTMAFGDVIGAGSLINGLSSPARQTSIRLAVPVAIYESFDGFAYTVLTDSWLGETTPPPPPPPSLTPPSASTQTPQAGAINIGSASTGAGSGTGTGGTGFNPTDAGFNWAAYCNSPDSLGNLRSPLWIQSCLAAELP
jgi:hypothetical protein